MVNAEKGALDSLQTSVQRAIAAMDIEKKSFNELTPDQRFLADSDHQLLLKRYDFLILVTSESSSGLDAAIAKFSAEEETVSNGGGPGGKGNGATQTKLCTYRATR